MKYVPGAGLVSDAWAGVVAASVKARGGMPAPKPKAGRSDVPPRGVGLQVRFARLPGLTPKGLLEDPFYFQVAPTETFRRTGSGSWQPFDTVGFGQVSQPGAGKEPEQFSFSSFFIDYDPSWAAFHYGTDPDRGGVRRASAPPVDPIEWINDLRQLRDRRAAFKLLVGDPAKWGRWFVRNLPVYIVDLGDEIRTEDDAIYFDITLSEYRGGKLARDELSKTPVDVDVYADGTARWQGSSGRRKMPTATLHKLAKEFYGSAGAWKTIATDAHNGHIRGYTGGRALADAAKRHGRGKPKHLRIHVPQRDTHRRATPDDPKVVAVTPA